MKQPIPKQLKEQLDELTKEGIRLSAEPGMVSLIRSIQRAKRRCTKGYLRRLDSLKPLTSESQLRQLKGLAGVIQYAWGHDGNLFLIVLMHIARLSTKGRNPYEVIGWCGFALIAGHYLDDDALAEALCEKAYEVLTSEDVIPEAASIAGNLLGGVIGPDYLSIEQSIPLLKSSIGATYGWKRDAFVRKGLVEKYGIVFEAGMSLLSLSEAVKEARHLLDMKTIGDRKNLLDQYLSSTDWLMGKSDLLTFEMEWSTVYEKYAGYVLYSTCLIWDGSYDEALEGLNEMGSANDLVGYRYLKNRLSYNRVIALTLRAFMKGRFSSAVGQVRQVKYDFEFYVRFNPDGFGHMYKVVSGCYELLCGHKEKAVDHFEKAIELGKNHSRQQDIAMVHLLLSNFYEFIEQKSSARFHQLQTLSSLTDWSAYGVADDLADQWQLSSLPENIEERWAEGKEAIVADVHDEALLLLAQLDQKNNGDDMIVDFCALFKDHWNAERLQIVIDEQVIVACEGKISEKAIAHVLNHGEMVLVNSDRNHELLKYDAYLMDKGKGSVMAIPLRHGEETYGALYVERDKDFSPRDVAVTELLTEQVAFLYGEKNKGNTD